MKRQSEMLEALVAETGWLRSLSASLVGDSDRAEDLTQDVLVAALERRPEPRGSLRPWLQTVVRRLWIDRLRTERGRPGVSEVTEADATTPPASGALARFELQRQVAQAVAELPEPYRAALLLRFYESRTPAQVANELGVPLETARTRIRRGLDRLRDTLDRTHGGREVWAIPLLNHAARPRDGGAAGKGGAWGSGGWIQPAFVIKASAAVLGLVVLTPALTGWGPFSSASEGQERRGSGLPLQAPGAAPVRSVGALGNPASGPAVAPGGVFTNAPVDEREPGRPVLGQEREGGEHDSSPAGNEDDLGHGYSRKGGFIFFAGERIDQAGKQDLARFARTLGRKLTLCNDVDAVSFEALSPEYTRDGNHAYYRHTSPGKFWVVQLPDADPQTLEVVGFNLARDAWRAWWYGMPLPGVEVATLELVKDGFAWRDAHHVWYQHRRIAGADPATFEHLGRGYYRDVARVYWGWKPLEGADPASFQSFGDDSPFGKDAYRVWFAERELPAADAATFHALHQSMYLDRHGVFEGPGRPMAEADVESFRKVADLDDHHTALFKDFHGHYLHVSYRNEVYYLKEQGGVLQVGRILWGEGENPRRLGTMRAELGHQGWTSPVIDLEPVDGEDPHRSSLRPSDWRRVEVHVLETFRSRFEQARERMR